MSRLIDADAFLKSEIKRCGCVPVIGTCTSDNEIFKFILERQPTVEAVPVVHGEWVKTSEYMPIYGCSICKERNLFKNGDNVFSNFCPNCGAKMDGKAV